MTHVDTMIAETLARLTADVMAVSHFDSAARDCQLGAIQVAESDIPMSQSLHHVAESIEHITRHFARELHDRAQRRAAQLGWQVATYEIAPVAKASGEEPIVWITGNSYMPPLRAFGVSEDVWQLDDIASDVWGVYAEAIEQRLGQLNILLDAPEYDNALYVVDLERFERIESEDEDAPDLQSEWRKIERE